jgi:hypothetical protein
MKSFVYISVVLFAAISASAGVDVRVCDPNDLHPLGMYEVMMGTQVSLVVYSDANSLWSGGLFIDDGDRGKGVLNRRDSEDPKVPIGGASCLEAAGERAFIMPWNDSLMSGFDLYTDEFGRTSGNWFVLDYTPLAEGECTINFYDHDYSFTVADPNVHITFANCPTRDWNDSGMVDYADWAVFASVWMAEDCAAPGWCSGADLDRDGTVGVADAALFADFWLWGTPNWQRPSQQDYIPESPGDPNVIYAILDPNGLSELSIPVGQSIRLYIDKTTLGENVNVFSLEVTISEPDLGWIDNTASDTDDPNAFGTAELLATPLSGWFDCWGPGYTQDAGIQFLGASFNEPINDGLIASFVYSATAEGTVTLSLIDYMDNAPTELRSIVLHQYAASMPMAMSGEETTSQSIEETVQMLEAIWEESSEIRESITEDEWVELVEAVKASDTSENMY